MCGHQAQRILAVVIKSDLIFKEKFRDYLCPRGDEPKGPTVPEFAVFKINKCHPIFPVVWRGQITKRKTSSSLGCGLFAKYFTSLRVRCITESAQLSSWCPFRAGSRAPLQTKTGGAISYARSSMKWICEHDAWILRCSTIQSSRISFFSVSFL